MKKKKLSLALIGCGRISKTHFKSIEQSSQVKLVAVYDTDRKQAEKACKDLKNIIIYDDYITLLKNKDIDLLHICTPSGTHSELAIKASQYGKHVIIEKPMALHLTDAKKLIRACKKNNTSLCVVLQNRYNKPVQLVKRLSKKLGKLYFISANVYWYRPQSYYDDGWHGTKLMDGGTLMNQGTHYVDILLYLSEKKVKKVSAFAATVGHRMEAEDLITVNLQFEDGTLGNIQANTVSYPENFEGTVTLFYEKATIRIGGKALSEIVYWKGIGENNLSTTENEVIDSVYGNNHYQVFENMYTHLLKGKPLRDDGEEGIKSLEIIHAAYMSYEKGEIIQL